MIGSSTRNQRIPHSKRRARYASIFERKRSGGKMRGRRSNHPLLRAEVEVTSSRRGREARLLGWGAGKSVQVLPRGRKKRLGVIRSL